LCKFICKLCASIQECNDIYVCLLCQKPFTNAFIHASCNFPATASIRDQWWYNVVNFLDIRLTAELCALTDDDLFHILLGRQTLTELCGHDYVYFRMLNYRLVYYTATLYKREISSVNTFKDQFSVRIKIRWPRHVIDFFDFHSINFIFNILHDFNPITKILPSVAMVTDSSPWGSFEQQNSARFSYVLSLLPIKSWKWEQIYYMSPVLSYNLLLIHVICCHPQLVICNWPFVKCSIVWHFAEKWFFAEFHHWI
jgi:hypothetical protein